MVLKLSEITPRFTRFVVGLAAILFLLPSAASAQYYNGSQMSFGQNRVQSIEMLWTFYRFKKFDVYFYTGGKNIAVFASRSADQSLAEIEKKLDYQLEKKVQLVIYNKLSDLRQTNIGLMGEEQYNTGGVTRIVGTKILLYFDGDHAHLENEIRAGLAQVLVNQMMYGGDLKDMLKNSAFLNLPQWYLNGLMSYMASSWNKEVDNRVKDGIISGRYRKFNKLDGEDAVYAGHSIWAYIADIYGESVIPNILYMTKISRNIESGFLFVLGTSMKNLTFEWLNYYTDRYTNVDKTRHLPDDKLAVTGMKKNRAYFHIRLSPDASKVAYVTNKMGKYKVWVQDLETGKRSKIFKQGFKWQEYRMDYSFPILDWHPTGKIIAMIREKKGHLYLDFHSMEGKRKHWDENEFLHFEKIADFSYSQDGKQLVLSGIRDGQSDIFLYTIASFTNEQLTHDIFDDLHPSFVRGDKGILFVSNRSDDTLRAQTDMDLMPQQKDIYYYDLTTRSDVLKRITNTRDVNEDYPQELDSAHFTFLSDENGISNRYVAKLDSVLSHIDTVAHYRDKVVITPITNYSRNIIEQDVQMKNKTAAELMFADGRFRMFVSPVQVKEWKPGAHLPGVESGEEVMDSMLTGGNTAKEYYDGEDIDQQFEFDVENYEFISNRKRGGKSDKQPEVAEPSNETPVDTTKPKEFKLPIQRNYDVTFFVDQLISQLDNSFLNSNYQAFTGGGEIYFMPGPNALFKFGVSDVLEDYKITGGFRLAGNLNSNEYMLSFENLKNRLDKQLIFHRQAFLAGSSIGPVKVHMHEISYKLKWPFNEVLSARMTMIYRNDRAAFLSSDLISLRVNNQSTNRAGLRGELVFDNTRSKGMNLMLGSRWKLFAEYYNNLDVMGSVRGNFIARLNPTKDHLAVLGADFRHYTRIHREIIWANRFATSTSLGTQKLIYYLGGVDNWLFPKFDYTVPIDYTQPYAFQAVATNMRGFLQGIRNGVSFAAINTEVRIPVFRYFSTRPVKSDFLYNFQIVGFGDMGTAWTGTTPYSSDNSLNTKSYYQAPISVTLTRQVEPIVAGFGAGLRAKVWGYFLRTDWAWGIEDGEVHKKPVFYLSLSLDY